MTLDHIRDALSAPDPYDAMDRLVRAELGAGRTTRRVYEELLPLVRATRRAAPLPEDADEILLGTLDAPTGDCDPDQCDQDPPAAADAGPPPRSA